MISDPYSKNIATMLRRDTATSKDHDNGKQFPHVYTGDNKIRSLARGIVFNFYHLKHDRPYLTNIFSGQPPPVDAENVIEG